MEAVARALIIVFLWLLCIPQDGWADAGPAQTSTVASESDESARVQRFREHVQDATEHYQQARYAEAVREFQAAYAIKAHPLLLFNLAQTYRRAGQPKDAISHYERFLAAAPDSPQATEVRRTLQELQASHGDARNPVTAPASRPEQAADNFLGSEEQRARLFNEHVQRASQHFSAGEYELAIRSFWAAYALRTQPIILFNVAQAHRRAKQWPQAQALFSRFLREDPNSQFAEEARSLQEEASEKLRLQQITEQREAALQQAQSTEALSERIAELRDIERQIVATHSEIERRQQTSIVRRRWFWPVLVGGIALTGAAVGLGIWLSRRLPDTELGGQPLVF